MRTEDYEPQDLAQQDGLLDLRASRTKNVLNALRRGVWSTCILAGFLVAACAGLFIIYQHYETQIHEYLRMFRIGMMILFPIFFIIGCYLVQDEPESLIAWLARTCLVVMGVCGYLCLGLMFGAAPNPAEKDLDPSTHFLIIIVAEIGIAAMAIATAVRNYRQEQKQQVVTKKQQRENDESV